jgi:hypothetical protein
VTLKKAEVCVQSVFMCFHMILSSNTMNFLPFTLVIKKESVQMENVPLFGSGVQCITLMCKLLLCLGFMSPKPIHSSITAGPLSEYYSTSPLCKYTSVPVL